MFFSLIIAIYNRKEELEELLSSLTTQTSSNFEIILVDDGSTEDLTPIVEKYATDLDLHYYKKENTGPGKSRNYGVQYAKGNYLLFIDSDCIAPKNYIEMVNNSWAQFPVDAFGGADLADKDFNDLQKAISFSMTSPLSTGGIRGAKKAVTKFQPRSFNMGVKKQVFEDVGGFSDLRIGEDPDLSLRIWEHGYSTAFFPEVKVFHKRRNSLNSFAKQVYEFGVARPILDQRHPVYAKFTFALPSFFYLGFIFAILCLIAANWHFSGVDSRIFYIPFLKYIFYFMMVFLVSSIQNKSIKIGFLSVITTATQLFNYGKGYLQSWYSINVLKKNPKEVFPGHFYG